MGECLIDEPQEHSYKKEPMLTGAIYDADQQCKFIFGNDYVKCPIGGVIISIFIFLYTLSRKKMTYFI